MNPASRTFAIEEVHMDRSQFVLNDLECVVAIDLITSKNGDRNPLDSGSAHPFQQMPVMLTEPPTEQRQRGSLRLEHLPVYGRQVVAALD